ncbi:hypothetical protein L6452_44263 [Arctium lappa]|uniref:Uncharacterized protein n=1 Tax=Arctium lappa TaxID=4217 RepID=A0ACB8XH07_ARCLA|nr:hypothetical protein L6452_44263 [Arctium lappa]
MVNGSLEDWLHQNQTSPPATRIVNVAVVFEEQVRFDSSRPRLSPPSTSIRFDLVLQVRFDFTLGFCRFDSISPSYGHNEVCSRM